MRSLFYFTAVIKVIIIDEVFNDGGVREAVDDALTPIVGEGTGFFWGVLNPTIAKIFEMVSKVIYEALDLDNVNQAARSARWNVV